MSRKLQNQSLVLSILLLVSLSLSGCLGGGVSERSEIQAFISQLRQAIVDGKSQAELASFFADNTQIDHMSLGFSEPNLLDYEFLDIGHTSSIRLTYRDYLTMVIEAYNEFGEDWLEPNNQSVDYWQEYLDFLGRSDQMEEPPTLLLYLGGVIDKQTITTTNDEELEGLVEQVIAVYLSVVIDVIEEGFTDIDQIGEALDGLELDQTNYDKAQTYLAGISVTNGAVYLASDYLGTALDFLASEVGEELDEILWDEVTVSGQTAVLGFGGDAYIELGVNKSNGIWRITRIGFSTPTK